jgi:iron complex transport system ATP-binding protein
LSERVKARADSPGPVDSSAGPGTRPPLLAARGLAIGWRAARGRGTPGAAGSGPLASGIDVEVGGGDFVVVLGPNGAGKSTLLRTLVGAQDPLAGEVELCGSSVGRLSVEDRATRAATVFTGLFDSGYFSVRDIVSFGRYPYTDARNRLGPRDREAVESAIASVGLGPLAGRRFRELSDGERQKALIARAVAQDCPVLVLDEPTAFLDAGARVEVFHLARKLARSAGKAVILSTHDVEHALRYADVLWLLDRERRFTTGAPESLVLSGSMSRAFDGGGFRFDPSIGAFRSAEEAEPLEIVVEGPACDERTWTERLAERLGFAVIADEADAGGNRRRAGTGVGVAAAVDVSRVAVSRGAGGPAWELRAGGAVTRYSEIEGLAAALGALASRPDADL